MSVVLRPYQREAIDQTYDWLRDNDGFPLIVLPTGTGKSLVIAEICRDAVMNWPDTRVIILSHVKELLSQNYAELIGLWPDAPAGIYSAGLNKRNLHAQIIFAGIQSIYKRAFEVQRGDLILIDEAHLVPEEGTTMYRKFLTDMRTINPQMRVIGLTATPYRMTRGLLHEGENAMFDDISYEYHLLTAIEEGYLAPLTTPTEPLKTRLNVAGVHSRGGEFIQGELEAAINQDPITEAAVAEMVQYGADRRGWLAFCAGVKHAGRVAHFIRQHGITCEVVVGDTPSAERAQIINAYKRQQIRCLASVGVLTTGFNAPHVDLLAMLRPTKSTGLYVQIAGRGTRLAEGKENCLVLDFAKNIERHGPVDKVRPPRKAIGDGEPGEAPVKTCDVCGSICAAAARECPDCGHIFPPPKLKIDHTAATHAIMSNAVAAEWVDVGQVFYAKHEKPGKPPSLRVEYYCGLRRHREWVSIENTGYPRQRAVSWWRQRAHTQVPISVDDALKRQGELRKPTQILIKPVGKYTEIIGVRFDDGEIAA